MLLKRKSNWPPAERPAKWGACADRNIYSFSSYCSSIIVSQININSFMLVRLGATGSPGYYIQV